MNIARWIWALLIALQAFRAGVAVYEHELFRLLDITTIACLAICCLLWTSRQGSRNLAEHYARKGGAR